jgi:hypothetical protein
MCCICAPVCVLNSSPDRWIDVPAPDDAKFSLPGFRFCVGDQFLHRIGRDRRIDGEHVRHTGDQHHRLEVFHVIERHLRIQARVDRVRADGAHQQRIAVGRTFRDQLGTDVATGARSVVDDERLPERFRQLLRDRARQDVGRAARRERDDDPHRLRRIRRRLCRYWRCE